MTHVNPFILISDCPNSIFVGRWTTNKFTKPTWWQLPCRRASWSGKEFAQNIWSIMIHFNPFIVISGNDSRDFVGIQVQEVTVCFCSSAFCGKKIAEIIWFSMTHVNPFILISERDISAFVGRRTTTEWEFAKPAWWQRSFLSASWGKQFTDWWYYLIFNNSSQLVYSYFRTSHQRLHRKTTMHNHVVCLVSTFRIQQTNKLKTLINPLR